jgi:putative hydrolase of HD superfamily
LPDSFTYRAILRSLFHDLPEAFTGDVITPVKKRIVEHAGKEWHEIEMLRLKPLIEVTPKNVIDDMKEFELLEDLPHGDEDLVGKLVKECDRLSMLLECIFEQSTGRSYTEMIQAYNAYARRLLSSPWRSIREIALYGLFRRDEG